jgi:hypothetical protein
MPRILSELQKTTVFDPVTEQIVELQYFLPTNTKRVEYANRLQELMTDKNVLILFPETRVNYGKELLAGIPEDYFATPDGKKLSSDPNSEDYRGDWKEIVFKFAPELLAALAERVFEAEAHAKRQRFMDEFIKRGIAVNLGEQAKKKTASQSS